MTRAFCQLGVVLAALSAPASAFALSSLKQVQVSNGERVDLYFDGKVGRSQIKTEYFNDTIQFSLTDVTVYPAKISSVTGGDIAKIFAYQYAPKLVRCRITVHGKAEDFRDKIKIDDRGKLLTISLGDGETAAANAETVRAQSPAAVAASGTAPAKSGEDREVKMAAPAPADAPVKADMKIGAGEKSLLDRIMKDSPSSAPAKIVEAPKAERAPPAPTGENTPLSLGSAQPPLAGGKPLASPMRVMGKFAIVLGLFGLVATVLRKFVRGEIRLPGTNKSGSFGVIRRFAANHLGKPARMIEIVSTHHLGPKKSIVVANIAGRMLVLGISNESINLITQLSNQDGGEAGDLDDSIVDALDIQTRPRPAPSGARARVSANYASSLGMGGGVSGGMAMTADLSDGPGPSFAGLLESADAKPSFAPAGANVRNQIRSRLEGLKPL